MVVQAISQPQGVVKTFWIFFERNGLIEDLGGSVVVGLGLYSVMK